MKPGALLRNLGFARTHIGGQGSRWTGNQLLRAIYWTIFLETGSGYNTGPTNTEMDWTLYSQRFETTSFLYGDAYAVDDQLWPSKSAENPAPGIYITRFPKYPP